MDKFVYALGVLLVLPASVSADSLNCPSVDAVQKEIMASQQTPSALKLASDVAQKIVGDQSTISEAQFYYILPLTLIEEATADGGLKCHYYEQKEVDASQKGKFFFTMTLQPKSK